MAQLPIDEALNRFSDNEERFDKFVNGPTGYTTSNGTAVEAAPVFLARVEAEADQAVSDAVDLLETQGAQIVIDAVEAKDATLIARDQAQAARDAAIVNSPTYPDEPTGRAAVADGAYFKVQGSGKIAAYEYRRLNSWSSTLVATFPAADGIVNKNDYEVSDVWNTFAIGGNAASLTIGAFTVFRYDGTQIVYTAEETFAFAGLNGYLVADCSGNATVITIGSYEFPWQEMPYLTKTRFILAYKSNGKWQSDHAPIQRGIEANPMLARTKLVHTIYDIGMNTTVTAGLTFNITSFRYGRQDGSYIAYTANDIFATPNADHYIICDVSGSVPVLSLGTRAHVWEEAPYLTPTRFIFAWKEVHQWNSDFPSIQRLIDVRDTIQGRFARISSVDYYDIGDYTKVLAAGTTFAIGAFRFGREDGSYGAYTGTDVFSTPGADHYIIVNFQNFAITLTLGTRAHAWEEVPYLAANTAILAYKEAGAWRSHFVGVQRLLDQFNPPPAATVTTTEKIVRVGGTIGVDCDYTSLKSALDDLDDGTATNRYILRVMNGVYDYSSLGVDYLGFRNYVDVIGQSRNGVKIIMRHPSFSSTHATFDAAYYGQHIERATIQNLTAICANGKGPMHVDSSVWGEGTIEAIDCNLINEDGPSSPHYQVSLACGLGQGQRVVARNCYGNGIMYAHNSSADYVENGCSFELYNCVMPYTVIGDLQTYGKDFYKIVGCKLEYIEYVVTDVFGVRSYLQPSFELDIHGTEVEYVKAALSVAGKPADGLWDEVFGGKHGVFIASIHSYNVCPTGTIAKGGLVALSDTLPMAIKPWAAGDKLYGVALDAFASSSDYGTVQHSGTVFMSASGTTPIAFNDAVELNSSGVVVKQSSGPLLGYARQALASGTATIKVKLVK